ncbi:hypothetical protein IC582_003104 [Cucumis melo]
MGVVADPSIHSLRELLHTFHSLMLPKRIHLPGNYKSLRSPIHSAKTLISIFHTLR